MKGTSRVSLLNELCWVDRSVRRKLHKLSLMYEMIFKLTLSSVMTGDRSASISPTRLRLNFSVLKYHLFQKNGCLAVQLLKIVNTIFCTPKVLLLCVKSSLPPLHNYSEIDGIELPMRKMITVLKRYLTLMVCFFSVCPIIYFLVQPFLLTSIPLCMFCSIVTCDTRCKQHNLSR